MFVMLWVARKLCKKKICYCRNAKRTKYHHQIFLHRLQATHNITNMNFTLVITYNVSKSDVIREPKFFSRPNQFSIAGTEFEEHLVSEEFLGEKSPQICTLADIFLLWNAFGAKNANSKLN